MAKRNNLARARKAWTAEEEKYVERHFEKTSKKEIATKLKRTEDAICRKGQKMGLNTYITEELCAKNIARAFSIDMCVIHRLIQKYGFPARAEQHGGVILYRIRQEDFWEWAEAHKNLLPWSRYELNSIPPDPEWVAEAKKNSTIKKNHHFSYTDAELMALRSYRRQGLTAREIAKIMNRSVEGIRHQFKKERKERNGKVLSGC